MDASAQIKSLSGLGVDEVIYLIKGVVQIPVETLYIHRATKAEAILQMLNDGWTAIPF